MNLIKTLFVSRVGTNRPFLAGHTKYSSRNLLRYG